MHKINKVVSALTLSAVLVFINLDSSLKQAILFNFGLQKDLFKETITKFKISKGPKQQNLSKICNCYKVMKTQKF